MKEELLIIGAGNVAKFIAYNIEEFGNYEVIGFLDDDAAKHDKIFCGKRVLGSIDTIDNYINEKPISVIIGVALPDIKFKLAKFLEGKNISFPTLVSKHAWLSKAVTLGAGNIIYPGVSINFETSTGDFVIINMNCAIGHNCTISSYATLAPGVNLGGFTKIGETADIGIGVATRQGTKIGNNSIVAGQAMVIDDIPDDVKVKGVPAKIF